MKIQLAPMEGVFDSVTRDIFSQIGGFDHFVTEFIRVSAHLLPSSVFYRYCPELHNQGRTRHGDPVFVQLLGSDYELMALNAERAVDLGAPGIDLNFGCPAKRVNQHEGGARLLQEPERVEGVVSAVAKRVGSRVPVTAKVRLGYENKDHCVDIAKAAENGGATHLTVHARTKIEGYKPPAHWHYIAKMKRAISIPVYANGDIWTVEDAKRCLALSECENLALGRSAFSNPSLALEIKSQLLTVPAPSPGLSWQDLSGHWLPYFIETTRQTYSDQFALHRTKQWTKNLGRQFPEALDMFESIKRSQKLQEISSVLGVSD